MTLHKVQAFVQGLAVPWFILADWNRTSEEVVNDTNLGQIGNPIMAHTDATCSAGAQRNIDWMLCKRNASGLIKETTVIRDAPIRPHFPVIHKLHARPRTVLIQDIAQPKIVPHNKQPYDVPPRWEKSRRQARDRCKKSLARPILGIID